MGLETVQFSFDLLDPWWPEPARTHQAERVRRAAESFGLSIHSAQIGIASYTYNGLLHPEPELRELAVTWWERAIEVAAAMGAGAVGGPLGALTSSSAAVGGERGRIHDEAVTTLARLAERCAAAGLSALLVEPTPQAREIPSSITEAARLARDLEGCRVPVQYVLDIGHALYEPLYGAGVRLSDWYGPSDRPSGSCTFRTPTSRATRTGDGPTRARAMTSRRSPTRRARQVSRPSRSSWRCSTRSSSPTSSSTAIQSARWSIASRRWGGRERPPEGLDAEIPARPGRARGLALLYG
jgi:hypothetical protein